MPPSPLDEAADLHGQGDARGAYVALRSFFGAGPNPLADVAVARRATKLLADLTRSFGGQALAEKVARCAAAPDDADALFGAAYDLYEEGQFEAAGALLYRADAVVPGQVSIVSELAGCLEKQLRYGEAALVLDVAGVVEHSPICAYLSGFCWLMSGEIERARARLSLIEGEQPDQILFVRDALAGMVARADALRAAGIPLGEHTLTAWQAAIDGTLLLHESPHGHDEPMRGRYAFVQDSAALEREGLARLRTVLEALGRLPPRIVAAPERGARILAHAASRVFGVPREEFRPGDTAPGLFVAWTLETVEDATFLQALHDHHPGQRLFVHASGWVEPFPYAPDVTTILHQHVTSPWTGGALTVDPETRATSRAAPDARDDARIGEEIAADTSPHESVTTEDHVVAVARALAGMDEGAPGFARAQGKRLHQRAGGPVRSNRFV